MKPDVRYAIVGLFVVILGLGGVAGVVWLTASTSQKSYEMYVTYIEESVSGLNDNASVTYRGVGVGHVSDIAIDPDNPQRIRVLLKIEEDTPIRQDTVATLVSQGITGLVHVELSGGTNSSPPLEAGEFSPYPEIQTGPSLFTRLDQTVTEMVETLSDTAAQLSLVAERIAQLFDEDNRDTISGILLNVEAVTGAIANRADSIESAIREIDGIMRNTESFTSGLPGLLAQITDSIDEFEDMASNIGSAAEAFEGTITTIGESAEQATTVVNQFADQLEGFTRNTPSQLEPLLNEFQQLAESLRLLTGDLQRDPSIMLLGPEVHPGPGEDQ